MENHEEHLKIHSRMNPMVKDPLKYKGKGRPRKSDYITLDELISRHLLAHKDFLKLVAGN